ncbi:DUF423 domain-containing protein [Gayadomonas joobiniege]|uniref:DUF423 domain-containing protein n=1 Tax=Gayadomonas joobiniege TaxID=1234606 RepID=UPI00036F0A6C|nr:DUF423 domain-containing protein [Gayadomonas joobiniege]
MTLSNKLFKPVCIFVASLYAVTAIVCGAFSAHALKNQLGVDQLDWIDTASYYQFVHCFLLLALPFVFQRVAKIAWSSFILVNLGIVFFSGSLYLMAFDIAYLGWVTPLGGLFLIFAWLLILLTSAQHIIKVMRGMNG